MRVTPESFDMHLRELQKHFELVFLGDWVAAERKGGYLPPRACAITFDDGWQDNLQYALPLLEKHKVPATLFAVANKIGTDFQFWPNIVASLMLQGRGEDLARHPLFSVEGLSRHSPSPEEVAACIRQLKSRTEKEIFQGLEELGWRELLVEPMPPALMTWPGLRRMQASGWVEVGSHTSTHQRLTEALSKSELSREIIDSRATLQKKLDAPVSLFCFPNGDYSPTALEIVRSSYDAAVTTQRGINVVPELARHEMVRIGIHEDVANTPTRFLSRLSGWV